MLERLANWRNKMNKNKKEHILYSQIKLSPMRNHKFKLLEDINYKDVTVPKGYRTDGASVPRIFWSLFPPNRTDYLPAAIIHDYLTDLEEYRKADDYFSEIFNELHIDKFSKFFMVGAVRLYHLLRYGVKWWGEPTYKNN